MLNVLSFLAIAGRVFPKVCYLKHDYFWLFPAFISLIRCCLRVCNDTKSVCNDTVILSLKGCFVIFHVLYFPGFKN